MSLHDLDDLPPRPWALYLIVLLALLLAALTLCRPARGDALIPLAARVPNGGQQCWFAAVETCGRHLGIKALDGFLARGGTSTATADLMRHSLARDGVTAQYVAAADVTFLRQALGRGLPVVVAVRHWSNTDERHAVVLQHIGSAAEPVAYGGGTVRDCRVTFVDPNNVRLDYHYPLAEFVKQWDGRAWLFDPAAQQAPPRPGAAAAVPPPPPDVLVPPAARRPPSNQDLRDGVNRPDDQFRFGCFGQGLGGLYRVTKEGKK